MLELFEENKSALALYTPLDALIAEYRKKKADIERIAAYVAGETVVMEFFLDGARVAHNIGSFSATSLFEVGPAIRSLDSRYWQKAMNLTDVLDLMPAGTRNEWSKQIRENKTPAFEAESVRTTLQSLLTRRAEFFADRVEGIFRNLSEEHLTNRPEGFSKRMIIGWMLNYGHISHDRANYIHDLRSVIARFSGRDEPPARLTYAELDRIHSGREHGEWHSFDGGAFRVRLYKKGTAHLEVHPQMSYRLNQVLAWRNPGAIPSEFRKAPKKRAKEHELHNDLIRFDVLAAINEGRFNGPGTQLSFHNPLSPSAAELMRYIGGVPLHYSSWQFEYDASRVVHDILRTGVVPDQRSHQYFPTLERMAKVVVELADIKDWHKVLEPEAGQGGIADHLPREQTTCVEISELHASVLKAKGFHTICTDFLAWKPAERFDRIVMNPPFSDGRAFDHVRYASTLLAPDGRLVSIMPASAKGKVVVEGLTHEWAGPYQGEFTGTSVSVTVLVLTPAEK